MKLGIEQLDPILNVSDIAASLRFYVDLLGFANAPWGDDNFTCVGKQTRSIYLCKNGQGGGKTWIWMGVDDAQAWYDHLQKHGAKLHGPPENYPWAYEFRVEDPDGHVIRIGSEPRES